MKTNLFRFRPPLLGFVVGTLGACVSVLSAAPLPATAAVHTRPDRGSPAITFLKAGTEPVAATSGISTTPAGWMAVELPGPFEVYVENKDLMKNLDVKPGAPMRLAPKSDAAVLAAAEAGDKTTITGLHGKWTQLNLEKKLVGYVNVGAVAGYVPPIATNAATAAPAPAPAPARAADELLAPAPVTPSAHGVSSSGQPAPVVNLGDGGPSALPRQFSGKVVSTRRPLTPRRPYDWALNDDAGKRFAYLDVSKLSVEQIDKYADHYVIVFGVPRSSADGKNLVIEIQSVQLK